MAATGEGVSTSSSSGFLLIMDEIVGMLKDIRITIDRPLFPPSRSGRQRPHYTPPPPGPVRMAGRIPDRRPTVRHLPRGRMKAREQIARGVLA